MRDQEHVAISHKHSTVLHAVLIFCFVFVVLHIFHFSKTIGDEHTYDDFSEMMLTNFN